MVSRERHSGLSSGEKQSLKKLDTEQKINSHCTHMNSFQAYLVGICQFLCKWSSSEVGLPPVLGDAATFRICGRLHLVLAYLRSKQPHFNDVFCGLCGAFSTFRHCTDESADLHFFFRAHRDYGPFLIRFFAVSLTFSHWLRRDPFFGFCTGHP